MRDQLEELTRSLFPGARLVKVEPLGPDVAPEGATGKAAGYGVPLRLTLLRDGREEIAVFRTASSDEFGHDRRSDRAESMLLDFDTFAKIPRHVGALDVGAIGKDGRLVSLRDCGEFYLVTAYAPGTVYAQDLRRIARDGERPDDARRCAALADYLVELHRDRRDSAARYRRTIRDLLGHGEGIFGMVDGYPAELPGATAKRLHELERKCLEWRWKLKERTHLARIHGDFHPFNVVFRDGVDFTVLDTSRGSEGEPADDVTAMAVNFAFFALEAQPPGKRALAGFWSSFWARYLEGSRDEHVLEAAAPYLTWRCLVLASPRFYPAMSAQQRDAILSLAERALAKPRFDPAAADELFR